MLWSCSLVYFLARHPTTRTPFTPPLTATNAHARLHAARHTPLEILTFLVLHISLLRTHPRTHRVMNGSSRFPAGGLRKPSVQGSMRAPARSGISSRNLGGSLLSSPAPSIRSRAATVSPRKASGESRDDHYGPPPRFVSEANINVVVRCRGRSEREKAENSAVIVSHPSTTEVALALGPLASIENKLYTFDRTFGPEADQQRIYDNVVQPLLNEVSRFEW